MAGLDHPVYLTRSAPFDASYGHLVFFDIIEANVTSRSSVLSCVAEAGGEAKLPDSVTIAEFRRWLAAVTDGEADLRSKPFTCICNVIKVADALNDHSIDQWIHIAAEKMSRDEFSTGAKEMTRGVLEGWSLLPDHLQHRVFQAAAFAPENLDRLLQSFPTHLHPSVLSAAITSTRALRMFLSDDSLPALKALVSLPASAPSVVALQLDTHENTHPGQHAKWEEISSRLAQALPHHTGLTSLLLPALSISSQQLSLTAIAKLTSLQSLTLNGLCVSPPSEGRLLKQALQALPQLHDLKLHLSDLNVMSTEHSQDVAARPSPQCCLADLLAPATALTSLFMQAPPCEHRQHRSSFTAAEPLTLPHLVQLTALFDLNLHLAASFLTHLSAPVTSLKLTDGPLKPQQLRSANSAPAAQQLLHSPAAFTQLRCFSAVLMSDFSGTNRVRAAFYSSLPAPFPAFQHLRSFSLAAEPAIVHRSVTLLAASAASLTQLCLCIDTPTEACMGCSSPHWQQSLGPAAWPEFFRALCQLQLQHLDMHWEIRCCDGEGLAALKPLTQLTFLRLSFWECLRPNVPADGDALAAMTRLQQLCIDCIRWDFKLQDSLASLRPLNALTSLTLKSSEADLLVPGLVEQLPPEALPDLQQLTVSLCDRPGTVRALVGFATALPALEQLTVHFICASEFYEVDGADQDSVTEVCMDGDSVEYYESSAVTFARLVASLKDTVSHLRSAAACAGVNVVLDLRDVEQYL